MTVTRKHKRNIEGIRKHAQKKHAESTRRADEAIRLLLREGRPVNFNTVAKAGPVSTAWLYRQEKLRVRIEHLRGEGVPKAALPRHQRASEDSKDKIISALRDRVKRVEEELKAAKEKLKVAYGRLAEAGLV